MLISTLLNLTVAFAVCVGLFHLQRVHASFSVGAIPMIIQTQPQALGTPAGIANFSASFGSTMGQNRCAGIYPAMLAVMIAPTVGVDPFSGSVMVTLIAIVTIGSVGVAGVGGDGATFDGRH